MCHHQLSADYNAAINIEWAVQAVIQNNYPLLWKVIVFIFYFYFFEMLNNVS